MSMFRRNYTGRWWTVYDDRDGMLGSIAPAERGPGWEWQTDLRGLRMAQQLSGAAPTLEAAQEAFKATYLRWRAKIADQQFDSVYRRSPPHQ